MKAKAIQSFYHNEMWRTGEIKDISDNTFQELSRLKLVISAENGESETTKVAEDSPVFGANRETKPLKRKTKVETK